MVRLLLYALYLVIDVKYLSASLYLPLCCLSHKLIIVFHDIGLYGDPVHRRFLQHGKVPDPGKGHMQGPGYWRCRKRKHVHIGPELLYLFLMGHSEALLLIYDKQPQILKAHILG